jgi:hypothetical protein
VLSNCFRVAVLAALALTAPAPARAAVKTWSLASEFAVAPNQANPNPDGYGNASVWSFRQSATLAHTPAGYALLPNFITDLLGNAGLQSWQGTQAGDPKDNFPWVTFNSLSSDAFPQGIQFPSLTEQAVELFDEMETEEPGFAAAARRLTAELEVL